MTDCLICGNEMPITNLRYCSRACNERHQKAMKLNGTLSKNAFIKKISSPNHAKLNAEQVSHIRKYLNDKVKMRIIAAHYGVSIATISHIKSGNTWNHVRATNETLPDLDSD